MALFRVILKNNRYRVQKEETYKIFFLFERKKWVTLYSTFFANDANIELNNAIYFDKIGVTDQQNNGAIKKEKPKLRIVR